MHFGLSSDVTPLDNNIYRWYHQFENTGCLCKEKSMGWPRVRRECSASERVFHVCNPIMKWNQFGRQKVLQKCLCPYCQLLQALSLQTLVYMPTSHMKYCCRTIFWIMLLFSEISTLHISEHVNTHYVCIWGFEHLHDMVQLQQDSSKLNVFCAISRQKVYGPFFFGEATVIGTSYLDVLQLWLFPQLVEDKPNNFIWQQYGALPHWHNNIHDWLNITVPECWIGRKGPNDIVLHGLYTHQIGHHVISTCGGSIKDVCLHYQITYLT